MTFLAVVSSPLPSSHVVYPLFFLNSATIKKLILGRVSPGAVRPPPSDATAVYRIDATQQLTLRRQHQDPTLLRPSADEALVLAGNRTSYPAEQCTCHVQEAGCAPLTFTRITRIQSAAKF